eukprot:TRINITY_DN6983_c0_g1_i1.p1 TRINITY_DN6983_c0_g1~~TRINITY_DN6983_c0_g1_i1.p1  ORF type:complete len:534 (-),score=182.09 TRINITY_DN6983_c0_g1_i1:64-1620(-)
MLLKNKKLKSLNVFNFNLRLKSSSNFNSKTFYSLNFFFNHSFSTLVKPQLGGQPLPSTHPFKLNSNEITIGITKDEYIERRKKLLNKLPLNSLVLLSAAPVPIMTFDIPYFFRQNTDFSYFSGFLEANAFMMLEKYSEKESKYTLFVPPRSPERELWDGARLGADRAISFLGADEAFEISANYSPKVQTVTGDLGKIINDIILNAYNKSNSIFIDDYFLNLPIVQQFNSEKKLYSIKSHCQQLRLIKSEAEQKLMRKAGQIGGSAFCEVMSSLKYGPPSNASSFRPPNTLFESDIQAKLEYECKIRGASSLSFPPVVANGSRALTLHYITNDMTLNHGDLVLVDGGCEYAGYNSDITRTFPVSGKFSTSQRKLYDAVLRIQLACIEAIKPGTTLQYLNQLSFKLAAEELVRLGIVNVNIQSLLNNWQIVRKFYPHSIGHWLGMDVHDTDSISGSEILTPGMCITCEPGLYIPDSPEITEEFRGMGIRIEDDILITSTGNEVLTSSVPKHADEIESLMN